MWNPWLWRSVSNYNPFLIEAPNCNMWISSHNFSMPGLESYHEPAPLSNNTITHFPSSHTSHPWGGDGGILTSLLGWGPVWWMRWPKVHCGAFGRRLGKQVLRFHWQYRKHKHVHPVLNQLKTTPIVHEKWRSSSMFPIGHPTHKFSRIFPRCFFAWEWEGLLMNQTLPSTSKGSVEITFVKLLQFSSKQLEVIICWWNYGSVSKISVIFPSELFSFFKIIRKRLTVEFLSIKRLSVPHV